MGFFFIDAIMITTLSFCMARCRPAAGLAHIRYICTVRNDYRHCFPVVHTIVDMVAGPRTRCSLCRLSLPSPVFTCYIPSRWYWRCGLSPNIQNMSGGHPHLLLVENAGGSWPTVGKVQPSFCALAYSSARLPSSTRLVDSTGALCSTTSHYVSGARVAHNNRVLVVLMRTEN